jgi:hypothetical protein
MAWVILVGGRWVEARVLRMTPAPNYSAVPVESNDNRK